MKTSVTSSGGLLRSTGGLTIVWFMKYRTRSCASLYQRLRVVLVGLVVVGVGAERREERRLVVGAAAEPAVGQPRPLRDRLEIADAVLGASGT